MPFRTNVLRAIEHLSPALAGRLEYHLGHWTDFFPWGGGPMNGQAARLEMTRSLIHACEIEQIIETGSFRGTTTEWLAQFRVPLLSVEINPRYAAFARSRLAGARHVEIRCGDSVQALHDWAQTPDITRRRTLFYLDAHWFAAEGPPLRNELELISRHFPFRLVIIDDFKVPDDPGYGFDDYDVRHVLDVAYLQRCRLGEVATFFPSVAGKMETGMRRGCIVLAAQCMASTLASHPLLRGANAHPRASADAAARR